MCARPDNDAMPVYARDLLAEQKFRKTRRKGGWAPTAYMQYVEVDIRPTTKYGGIYARESLA